MDIAGKKAIITGGASGLGLATAKHLIAKGAQAALWDLNNEAGEKAAAELDQGTTFSLVDISDEESVAAAVTKAVDELGGIDIVVNCAGVLFPSKILSKKGPADMGPWAKTIQINLIGTFNVIRLTAAQMSANDPGPGGERGVIINTASVAAYDGQIGQTAYAASKAGLVGLTLPAARELAPLGIRVVTIAPGIFLTPMLMGLPENVQEALGKSVPFPSRLGDPSEFAAMAGHIVENAMLNGETIRLDGALRMAPR